MSFLMNNYSRLKVSFAKGEGVYLYDQDNKKYLDALAGISVCNLGYNNQEINQVIKNQIDKIWHTSNLFEIPAQEQAAEKLCRLSGMDKVIFSNSGAEANEAAIKIARIHGRKKGIDNPLILSFKGAFHGRTFGAMAATYNPKVRAGFEPHLKGFAHLPFNDIEAIKAYRYNSEVVAVMLECVQGEGGLHPVKKEYLEEVRKICDAQGWLLICDEVQIGMYRSGKFLGCQNFGVMPDVITMAKSLANGLPVGACLAKGEAANYIQAGMHGSTFAGSPLVMTVVNKVLELCEKNNLAEHTQEISKYLKKQLQEKLGDLEIVKEVRGLGLMLGIELKEPIPDLVAKGLEKGVVINLTAGKVLRLLPPLIYQKEHCDELTQKLYELLR